MVDDCRRQELERAMRAHPAGKGLVRGGGAGRGVVRPAAAAPGRAPLRLTARGRRLVATLALMVLLGVAGLVSALLDASGATGDLHLAGQSRVVVRPGDTLWSIASSVAGQDDVRAVVYRIRQVNHLHGTELMPGEVLVLP